MNGDNVKIKFKTITPIWTGNAYKKYTELKPNSIIGSLRYWFEVYCHFSKIKVSVKEEKLIYKEYKEKFKEIINNTQNISLQECEKKLLESLPLSLSSKIFGCTGWKSRIELKSIEYKESTQYPYPIGEYTINKESKNKESKWFFNKGFFGTFTITFNASKNIQNNVLFPLLYFIEKYGFIGAKNNLGYGRVSILEPKNISSNKFNLIFLGEKKNNIHEENIFSPKKDDNFSNLKLDKIEIFKVIEGQKDLKSLIEVLIQKKNEYRNQYRKLNKKHQDTKQEERHILFGSIKKANWERITVPQATKIIPLITKKDNDTYKGEFVSIFGIKNFGEKNEL